ncbi:MAG: hypothetical protein RLO50_06370 [Azospirillaceae bacterium]
MTVSAPAAARSGRTGHLTGLPFYLAVGLIAGAVIAYQLTVMRIFAVASWTHFGSLVVSIAMFGFGVVSAVMVIGKDSFQRRWEGWVSAALLAFGPLMVIANTVAQTVPFNPIFLVVDPEQKWRLALSFILYFLPFVPGALFIGLAFLKGQDRFGRVYFADMTGSGLCGLVLLIAMYVLFPETLLAVPVGLWALGGLAWFLGGGMHKRALALVVLAGGTIALMLLAPQINTSPYKGVSYARAFPDAQLVYEDSSPFGHLEVYDSSYFHFAPGLSDMAALNLPEMPTHAYLGMFIDGDGPIGIIRSLPESQLGYFRFLPMYMPYLLHAAPEVFVVQFGGGISTELALSQGASAVTVAEGNPMVLDAVRGDTPVAEATGHVLDDERVTVIPYDGRLYAPQVEGQYDIVDLSLADSTGLSSPGGFAVFENHMYARESVQAYMRALRPDGVLSMTVWNKENPPKSVLRVLATVVAAAEAEAARDGGPPVAERFHISHTFLSTLTILYQPDGFDAEEAATLDSHAGRMAFELLYRPGQRWEGDAAAVFRAFSDLYFDPARLESEGADVDMTAGNLYRLVIDRLIAGDLESVREAYVFDIDPVTTDRPYLVGYLKSQDLPTFFGMLEAVSDEWGYLLLWATFAVSLIFGSILLLIPVVFGWRSIFARQPGKLGVLIYFLCLGLGYIVVEIGMISKFMIALSSPTVSASVLITGMLVFTGLGSLASGRYLDRCRRVMPFVYVAIAALIALYALGLDPVLEAIGVWPYWLRIAACLALMFPPAFLMGFPFPVAMAMLSRLGKEHLFLWAWGINGMFSVIGAVTVPLVAVQFGMSSAILIGAIAYLIAWPAFRSVLKPGAAGLSGVGAEAGARA